MAYLPLFSLPSSVSMWISETVISKPGQENPKMSVLSGCTRTVSSEQTTSTRGFLSLPPPPEGQVKPVQFSLAGQSSK